MRSSFLVRTLLLTAVSLLGLAGARAAQPVASASATSWPMYQGDAGHSGFTPASLGSKPAFYLRWKHRLEQVRLNPVTVAEGKVFVTQDARQYTHSAYAVDAEEGRLLWRVQYGQINSCNPPSYWNGRVYLQTGNHSVDTFLRAYDAGTGQSIFSSPHDAQWQRYLAPTLYDGKVYVNGGHYGGMYAFDGQSGEQLWFTELPSYDEWTPAADAQYVYACIGENEPGLYVLNRLTGELAFRIPDPGYLWGGWTRGGAPLLGSAGTVFGAYHRRLVCFDLNNRNIRWTAPIDLDVQPALRDGVIYAIRDGGLVAFNEQTGAELWSWYPQVPIYRPLIGDVLLTQGHAVVYTQDELIAVSLATHTASATYPAGGHVSYAEGAFYIASDDGTLLAVGLGTPRLSAGSQMQWAKVKVGKSKQATLKVKNTGDVPLTLFGINGLALPFRYLGPEFPVRIAPGASRTLAFSFSPNNKKAVTQKVWLETNDRARTSFRIKLQGAGR